MSVTITDGVLSVVTITDNSDIVTVATSSETVTISQVGAQGIKGDSGAGFTPTASELLILQQATQRKDYSVDLRYPDGQMHLLTYDDADGYTLHSALWSINAEGQYTILNRTFTFGGEVWVYEIEHLWSVSGYAGIQVNTFTRTAI